MDRLNIFNFQDYRTYLKATFESSKIKNSHWSYGLWAKKLRLGGASVLTNILSGKKQIGLKVEQKLIEFFSFSKQEEAYFKSLVSLDRAKKDPILWREVAKNIRRDFPKQSANLLDEKVWSLISKWHYVALLEMEHLKEYKADAAWLQKRLFFKVTLGEIERALENLRNIDLKSRNLKTTNDVKNAAIHLYHKNNLVLADIALETAELLERDFSARVFNIEKKDLSEIKARIQQFRDELASEFEAKAKAGDETYQLCIQFFPLTKLGESS